MDPLVNLNEQFGKALLEKFFEPVISGYDPEGRPFYQPSGVSVLASNIYQQHGKAITDAVCERLDMDALAEEIGDHIIVRLTEKPTYYDPHKNFKAALEERIMNYVVAELGKKAVEGFEIQLGLKEGVG